jgi:hypothetical protein
VEIAKIYQIKESMRILLTCSTFGAKFEEEVASDANAEDVIPPPAEDRGPASFQ